MVKSILQESRVFFSHLSLTNYLSENAIFCKRLHSLSPVNDMIVFRISGDILNVAVAFGVGRLFESTSFTSFYYGFCCLKWGNVAPSGWARRDPIPFHQGWLIGNDSDPPAAYAPLQ